MLVDSSSLSSVVWFLCLVSKLFYQIMNHYCTKHIPVSCVLLRTLVPGISLCQLINELFYNKDILCVSACHNVSRTTREINERRSVTPVSLIFDVLWHQGSWHSIVLILISLPYVTLFLFACPFSHHLYNYSNIYLLYVTFYLQKTIHFALRFCI